MIDTLVGSKVKLKVPCLGNDVGTIGYVYEVYPDYDNPKLLAISVIFKNGKYCGFSAEEQNILDFVDYFYKYSFYGFKSVYYLELDFNHGFWNFDENNQDYRW